MGFIRANKPLTEPQIPQAIARDSEVTAAIAAHINAADPHTQYVLERLSGNGSALPLLFCKPPSGSQFDANTWNPNQGQAHFSAINVASGGSFIPSGLPPMQLIQALQGTLIQVEPFSDSDQGNTAALQFFVGAGVWIRTIGQQWVSLAFLNQPNFFTTVQNFLQGVTIGSSGTLIKKILSQEFTIDPPLVQAGSVAGINLTVNGASVGDIVYVSPVGPDIWNTAIWPFEFPAVVSDTNNVALFLRNDWLGQLDLAAFKIRVVVMGF